MTTIISRIIHGHDADAIGRQITTVGYKNGWCVMDLSDWQDSGLSCDRYNCNNQGISAGCSDIYASSLDCQWIDITTILDGNYTVRVTTNPYKRLAELDYSNNTAEVTVEISGDDVRVVNVEDLQSKEPNDTISDDKTDDATDGGESTGDGEPTVGDESSDDGQGGTTDTEETDGGESGKATSGGDETKPAPDNDGEG